MPQLQAIVVNGQFHCATCSTPLVGYDALFDICNDCALGIITEPTTKEGYCSLHPGCGCQSPSECTEESKAKQGEPI